MTFRPSGQIKGRIQPALLIEVGIEVIFDFRWRRQHAGFKHLRLESHQHGGGQEGFAAVSQIPLVAAAPSGQGGRHLPGNLDALPELIQKAVDDGNHIHIPGIEIAPLRCVLQQPNRKAGSSISAVVGGHLEQVNSPFPGKVSVLNRCCQCCLRPRCWHR